MDRISLRGGSYLFLAYLGILVVFYLPTIHLPIISDDLFYINVFEASRPGNPVDVMNPCRWGTWIRPVHWGCLWLQWRLFGDEYWAYRLTGLIFHALNGLLIFKILTGNTEIHPRTCHGATLLFLVYPGSVHTLVWLSAQCEIIWFTFALVSFVLYGKWRDKGGGWRWVAGMSLFYALALCAKETALIYPVILSVLELNRIHQIRRPPDSGRVVRTAGIPIVWAWGLTGLYLGVRYCVLDGWGAYGSITFPPFPVNSGEMAAFFKAVFLVMPAQYVFPLRYHLNGGIAIPIIVSAISALCVLAFSGRILARSGRRTAVLAFVFMVLMIYPGLSFTWRSGNFTLPARYMYAGSAALCLGVAALALSRDRFRYAGFAVVAAWLPLFVINQYSFVQAGRITERVCMDLTRFCVDLSSGVQIIVAGIPSETGLMPVEVHHPVMNVFNLEMHRRCGLLPPLDWDRDTGYPGMKSYLERLPGVVSTVQEGRVATAVESPLRPMQILLQCDPQTGALTLRGESAE
ncbi:hypothetical protein JXA40_11790 [bacterium]|nr:hypothetical protein [candidate division CSSED10-310 bacterium]